jgi:Spy/CpxP family protein refolding chaperone
VKVLGAVLLISVSILATGLWLGKGAAQKTRSARGYLDMISLSAEQMRKVEKIRDDFLPKVDEIRGELRKKRLRLNDLIFEPKPDMKAIDLTGREISDLQARLEREVISHILEEKEMLTSDQRMQFYEIIKKEFEKGGLGVHGEKP